MAFLWTDTLASLLVEADGVAPERLDGWFRNPVAYRLDDGQDALALARRLLVSPPQAGRGTGPAGGSGGPCTS